MKNLKASLLIIASLSLLCGAGYLFASSSTESTAGFAEPGFAKPGFARLITPQGPSINTIISVNIGPREAGSTHWLVDNIMGASDGSHAVPERIAKRLLNQLQGLQLRVFEVNDNRQEFDNAIAESVAMLAHKRWETMATIRDGDKHIVVMHTGDDEQINGLSIMLSTQHKAVFANLIGPFDPQSIAEAVQQMN